MLEKIVELEKDFFLWLNHFQSEFADTFFWLYSGVAGWIPIVLFVAGCWVYRNQWREWTLILLSVLIVILMCDLFTTHLTKPLFARFRPTHHPFVADEVKTVFGKLGDLYGFMSGHSANAFGFVVLSSLIMKYKPYTFIISIWAVIMVYSRIYLGVHFISDVVCGACAGALFGYWGYRLYCLARKKLLAVPGPELNRCFLPQKRKSTITYIIAGYILLIGVICQPLVELFGIGKYNINIAYELKITLQTQ